MKKFLFSVGLILTAQQAISQCTPVFTPNADVYVNADAGSCNAVVTYSNPTFTGCASGSLNQTAGLPSGSSFPIGITTNTFEVMNSFIYFSEDFSDNSAGWTLGTEWSIGSATSSGGQAYGNPDPGTDNTSTADNGVAGVIIGGNASTSLHGFYYLTSPVINTTGATSLNLEYYRWLNSDYSPYMINQVEVFNGSTWVVIWASGSAPGVQDASWNLQTHNILAYSNAALQVRFGFNVGSSGVFTVSSWNLDDVTIKTNPIATGVTSSFNVVVSNTAPVVTCPSNISATNTSGAACNEAVNYTAPVVSTCGTTTDTYSGGMVSGSDFPVGTTTVNFSTLQNSAAFTTFLFEDFSDNSAGWLMDPEWGIGSATTSGGQNYGNGDPASDYTATSDNGVAGVVIGGNASTAIHGYYYLTSPVINTTGSTSLNLNYYRWLNSDYAPYIVNVVQVYDGTTWQTIWQSGSAPGVQDASWTLMTHNIQAYSNAALQVRFGFNINSGAFTISSWNLDNINIYGNAALSSSCSFDVTVQPYAGVASDAFCAGSTYTFGSQSLTTGGTYVENFAGIGGCDSTVTLTLVENPIYNEVASASICQGDTYVFGTQTLNADGVYTEVFTSMNGCDSTVTLSLAVNQTYNNVINQSICDGDSYLFAGTNYTTAGTYVDNNISMSGCDSITTLNLTVNMPYTGTDTDQICNGSQYVFGSQILTTAGDYTEVFQDINGCDSTVTLTLAVVDAPTITLVSTTDEIGGNDGAIDVTVASANAFTISWSEGSSTEDITGLAGGNYTVTVTDDVTGCISTLDVVVNSQVGITEHTTQLVNVYPNPNKGIFVVNAGNEIISQVTAIDNLGRLVKIFSDLDSSKPVLDMSGFEPGSYQLIILVNDTTVLRPVMIH